LTHSGRFSHISGHPSATGRAQDRESTPAEDRHSTTEPRNHMVFNTADYVALHNITAMAATASTKPRNGKEQSKW